MLKDAGPDLDRQIERKLNGDAKKKTPPYSTSEKAANRLLRRLEMQDMPCSVEQIDGVWYCTFWIVFESSRERLSTGSGETRELAIARAVMNARLGMGASLSSGPVEDASRRLQRSLSSTATPGQPAPECAGCGVELPTRNREATNRFCTVCSWRAGKRQISGGSTRRESEASADIPISSRPEQDGPDR